MADDRSDRVAIWQTYVQTAENTSTRREAVNRYMVFAHLAIFSAHFALSGQLLVHIAIAGAGIVVAALWVILLRSHGKINKAKYRIIQELEADLPYQPFNAEANLTGIDSRRIYPELSKVQMIVAVGVFAAHFLVMAYYLGFLACEFFG